MVIASIPIMTTNIQGSLTKVNVFIVLLID